MIQTNHRHILVICEDRIEAKIIQKEMTDNLSGNVISSGFRALELIKTSPQFSEIFIPLDLKDLDYSDFIRFARRYSPGSNYILIAPAALPDLGWLVLSNEIDGYVREPLNFPIIFNYHQKLKHRVDSPRSILLYDGMRA